MKLGKNARREEEYKSRMVCLENYRRLRTKIPREKSIDTISKMTLKEQRRYTAQRGLASYYNRKISIIQELV